VRRVHGRQDHAKVMICGARAPPVGRAVVVAVRRLTSGCSCRALVQARAPAGRTHSSGEQRFALLGYSEEQRLLAVMFTWRGDRIRLISARKATRHERHDYEEGKR